jgi:hypothetical protein
MAIITPRRTNPYLVRNLLIPIKANVGPGSVAPRSVKVVSNFGTMKIISPITAMVPIDSTMSG